MSYEELSSLPAGSSGNANEKSGPKGLPASAFGKATVPEKEVIQARPNYVFINNTGSYAFANVSGSISSYQTGSVRYQSTSVGAPTPIQLHINPVAWRRTDEASATGDVTFVYQGGL
jgi:hypothetical protein